MVFSWYHLRRVSCVAALLFHKGPGWGGFQGLDTHADSDVECRQASAAADAFSANLGRQRPCLSPLWPQGLTTC
eukprot:scaffold15049_cov18-Tisochrysis_lutea.AAC.1